MSDVKLTARERQIVTLLTKELTAPEIAARLKLSPHTVRDYVRHVRTKLRVRSQVGIAVWATRQGGF